MTYERKLYLGLIGVAPVSIMESIKAWMELGYNQYEIAEIVGTSQPTVNRCISKLKRSTDDRR